LFILKKDLKFVSNKSEYTNWTHGQGIKNELYSDKAVLLRKSVYLPHQPTDDAYDEIIKQIDSFNKYDE